MQATGLPASDGDSGAAAGSGPPDRERASRRRRLRGSFGAWRPLRVSSHGAAAALVAQVTAFTVAHTVALALSMPGVVRLPPAIVEPLIAGSIVYVAVENVLARRLHSRSRSG